MAGVAQEYGAAAEARADAEMAAVSEDLRWGILDLPCDVVHTPATMRSAVRRVAASLPAVSPYSLLSATKRDLVRVEEQLQKLNVANDEALRAHHRRVEGRGAGL